MIKIFKIALQRLIKVLQKKEITFKLTQQINNFKVTYFIEILYDSQPQQLHSFILMTLQKYPQYEIQQIFRQGESFRKEQKDDLFITIEQTALAILPYPKKEFSQIDESEINKNALDQLQYFDIFKDLKEYQKNQLKNDIAIIEIFSNQILINQDEPSNYLYLIISGEISVEIRFINNIQESKLIELSILSQYQMFGLGKSEKAKQDYTYISKSYGKLIRINIKIFFTNRFKRLFSQIDEIFTVRNTYFENIIKQQMVSQDDIRLNQNFIEKNQPNNQSSTYFYSSQPSVDIQQLQSINKEIWLQKMYKNNITNTGKYSLNSFIVQDDIKRQKHGCVYFEAIMSKKQKSLYLKQSEDKYLFQALQGKNRQQLNQSEIQSPNKSMSTNNKENQSINLKIKYSLNKSFNSQVKLGKSLSKQSTNANSKSRFENLLLNIKQKIQDNTLLQRKNYFKNTLNRSQSNQDFKYHSPMNIELQKRDESQKSLLNVIQRISSAQIKRYIKQQIK